MSTETTTTPFHNQCLIVDQWEFQHLLFHQNIYGYILNTVTEVTNSF